MWLERRACSIRYWVCQSRWFFHQLMPGSRGCVFHQVRLAHARLMTMSHGCEFHQVRLAHARLMARYRGCVFHQVRLAHASWWQGPVGVCSMIRYKIGSYQAGDKAPWVRSMHQVRLAHVTLMPMSRVLGVHIGVDLLHRLGDTHISAPVLEQPKKSTEYL
jgi:hypothetical protein